MNQPHHSDSSANSDSSDRSEELFNLFQARDESKTAGDVLDDVLLTPGVIIRLAKHGLCSANLSVTQNGIFSHKHDLLKNWIIGESAESRALSVLKSNKNGPVRPCTITIDPRDIEDARWAGASKTFLGFIVIATVSDDEGVHRCATKIVATPELVKIVKKPLISRASQLGTIDNCSNNSSAGNADAKYAEPEQPESAKFSVPAAVLIKKQSIKKVLFSD